MICCENVVDVKFLKNEKLNYIKKKKKKTFWLKFANTSNIWP